MDRILFIIPPHISFNSFVNPIFNERKVTKKSGTFGSIVTDMPIGLLSLSAYLKNNANVEIKLIDFNIVLNKMEIFEYNSFLELFHKFFSTKEWKEFFPNIIGISTLFTTSYYNMLDIAKVSRELFPKAIITAGGGIPTNMYKKIFEDSICFDALCLGEGEIPLLGLVNAKDKQDLINTDKAWITREKIERNESFNHNFIQDLDEIPFLDYDILDLNEYRSNSILSLFPLAKGKMESMPLMTSRGCPHHCCFCSSRTVHGRDMRYYSLLRVREDLKRLSSDYGAKTIIFQDDHLMSDKKRVLEIIDILREYQLTAFFPNSLALYALDRRILDGLKSIGLNQIVLSVESGSERVLREVMHKPLNLSIVRRVIADCRQLGIATDISIMIGLPGETKQDIEDARAFLKTLNASWFRISMATPLVGSEMFDICIKNDYIKGDYMTCDFKKAVVETEEFSAEYIQEKAYSLNLELNFVENNDFKSGDYEKALKGFLNVISVKDDHAFASYFAAKCLKKMGLEEKYNNQKSIYNKIIKDSDFWKEYAIRFKLVPLE